MIRDPLVQWKEGFLSFTLYIFPKCWRKNRVYWRREKKMWKEFLQENEKTEQEARTIFLHWILKDSVKYQHLIAWECNMLILIIFWCLWILPLDISISRWLKKTEKTFITISEIEEGHILLELMSFRLKKAGKI